MVATHHVGLAHILRTEAAVRGRVVVLEGLDDTTLQRRDDLAARELCHFQTHALHDIGGQTDRAVLQTLEVLDILDR